MNLRKFVSIIAIIAIIGFVFFSCGEENDPGKTTYGENLNLSGQVYNYPEVSEKESEAMMTSLMVAFFLEQWSTVQKTVNDNFFADTEKFKGNLSVEDGETAETGNISNGSFSFKMGAPGSIYLNNIEDYLNKMDEESKPSADNMNAKYYEISEFSVTNNDKYSYLSRGSSSGKVTITNDGTLSTKIDYETITYVYVAENVKITAKEYKDTEYSEYGITATSKSVNLSLKKGWNVVKGTIKGILRVVRCQQFLKS